MIWQNKRLALVMHPSLRSKSIAVLIAIAVGIVGYFFLHGHAASPYDGKLLLAPNGDVFWIHDNAKHYVGNDLLLNCIRVRGGANDSIPVDQGTVDGFGNGYSGYCPYPGEVRFVRGDSQAPVWRVYTDGTRRHALSLCPGASESLNSNAYTRTFVMPAGEVDGHRNLGDWSPTPDDCNPPISSPHPNPSPSPPPQPSPQPQPNPNPTPAPQPQPSPTPSPNQNPGGSADIPGTWKLVFDDEFQDNQLDLSKWLMCNPSFTAQNDLRYCRTTYNDEQQLFRASPNNPNVQVSNNLLRLIATKENGQVYSGMVSTGPNVFGYNQPGYKPFSFLYGYYEARAKFPKGKGLWPSFWMLPDQSNCATYPAACTGWPESGEYDVVEIPGNDPTEVHMTEHDGQTGGAGDSTIVHIDTSADFHTFGIDWEPGFLKWYIDGKLMKTYTGQGVKNYPFYPIANFSVGGANSWGGSDGPLHGGYDASTPFPSEFDISWIRVYQHP